MESSFEVTPEAASQLQMGQIVRVVISGRVTGIRSYDCGPGEDERQEYRVDVEGEASISPGSLDDAARMAFSKLSNARGPKDFTIGQRELHAP